MQDFNYLAQWSELFPKDLEAARRVPAAPFLPELMVLNFLVVLKISCIEEVPYK